MKTGLFAVICAISLLDMPARLSAQDRTSYVSGKLGVYEPSGDLDDQGFGTGFNLEATLGTHLNRYLSVEGTTGFFITDADFAVFSSFFGFGEEEDTLFVYPFEVSLRATAPLGRVNLYCGGGPGFYIAVLNSELDFGGFEDDDSDADAVFGGHLFGGMDFLISERMFLGVEARFIWTGEADLEPEPFGIPIRVKTDLNGYRVSAVFGLRF
jgi:opacity protein-like surface antigen